MDGSSSSSDSTSPKDQQPSSYNDMLSLLVIRLEMYIHLTSVFGHLFHPILAPPSRPQSLNEYWKYINRTIPQHQPVFLKLTTDYNRHPILVTQPGGLKSTITASRLSTKINLYSQLINTIVSRKKSFDKQCLGAETPLILTGPSIRVKRKHLKQNKTLIRYFHQLHHFYKAFQVHHDEKSRASYAIKKEAMVYAEQHTKSTTKDFLNDSYSLLIYFQHLLNPMLCSFLSLYRVWWQETHNRNPEGHEGGKQDGTRKDTSALELQSSPVSVHDSRNGARSTPGRKATPKMSQSSPFQSRAYLPIQTCCVPLCTRPVYCNQFCYAHLFHMVNEDGRGGTMPWAIAEEKPHIDPQPSAGEQITFTPLDVSGGLSCDGFHVVRLHPSYNRSNPFDLDRDVNQPEHGIQQHVPGQRLRTFHVKPTHFYMDSSSISQIDKNTSTTGATRDAKLLVDGPLGTNSSCDPSGPFTSNPPASTHSHVYKEIIATYTPDDPLSQENPTSDHSGGDHHPQPQQGETLKLIPCSTIGFRPYHVSNLQCTPSPSVPPLERIYVPGDPYRMLAAAHFRHLKLGSRMPAVSPSHSWNDAVCRESLAPQPLPMGTLNTLHPPPPTSKWNLQHDDSSSPLSPSHHTQPTQQIRARADGVHTHVRDDHGQAKPKPSPHRNKQPVGFVGYSRPDVVRALNGWDHQCFDLPIVGDAAFSFAAFGHALTIRIWYDKITGTFTILHNNMVVRSSISPLSMDTLFRRQSTDFCIVGHINPSYENTPSIGVGSCQYVPPLLYNDDDISRIKAYYAQHNMLMDDGDAGNAANASMPSEIGIASTETSPQTEPPSVDTDPMNMRTSAPSRRLSVKQITRLKSIVRQQWSDVGIVQPQSIDAHHLECRHPMGIEPLPSTQLFNPSQFRTTIASFADHASAIVNAPMELQIPVNIPMRTYTSRTNQQSPSLQGAVHPNTMQASPQHRDHEQERVWSPHPRRALVDMSGDVPPPLKTPSTHKGEDYNAGMMTPFQRWTVKSITQSTEYMMQLTWNSLLKQMQLRRASKPSKKKSSREPAHRQALRKAIYTQFINKEYFISMFFGQHPQRAQPPASVQRNTPGLPQRSAESALSHIDVVGVNSSDISHYIYQEPAGHTLQGDAGTIKHVSTYTGNESDACQTQDTWSIPQTTQQSPPNATCSHLMSESAASCSSSDAVSDSDGIMSPSDVSGASDTNSEDRDSFEARSSLGGSLDDQSDSQDSHTSTTDTTATDDDDDDDDDGSDEDSSDADSSSDGPKTVTVKPSRLYKAILSAFHTQYTSQIARLEQLRKLRSHIPPSSADMKTSLRDAFHRVIPQDRHEQSPVVYYEDVHESIHVNIHNNALYTIPIVNPIVVHQFVKSATCTHDKQHMDNMDNLQTPAEQPAEPGAAECRHLSKPPPHWSHPLYEPLIDFPPMVKTVTTSFTLRQRDPYGTPIRVWVVICIDISRALHYPLPRHDVVASYSQEGISPPYPIDSWLVQEHLEHPHHHLHWIRYGVICPSEQLYSPLPVMPLTTYMFINGYEFNSLRALICRQIISPPRYIPVKQLLIRHHYQANLPGVSTIREFDLSMPLAHHSVLINTPMQRLREAAAMGHPNASQISITSTITTYSPVCRPPPQHEYFTSWNRSDYLVTFTPMSIVTPFDYLPPSVCSLYNDKIPMTYITSPQHLKEWALEGIVELQHGEIDPNAILLCPLGNDVFVDFTPCVLQSIDLLPPQPAWAPRTDGRKGCSDIAPDRVMDSFFSQALSPPPYHYRCLPVVQNTLQQESTIPLALRPYPNCSILACPSFFGLIDIHLSHHYRYSIYTSLMPWSSASTYFGLEHKYIMYAVAGGPFMHPLFRTIVFQRTLLSSCYSIASSVYISPAAHTACLKRTRETLTSLISLGYAPSLRYPQTNLNENIIASSTRGGHLPIPNSRRPQTTTTAAAASDPHGRTYQLPPILELQHEDEHNDVHIAVDAPPPNTSHLLPTVALNQTVNYHITTDFTNLIASLNAFSLRWDTLSTYFPSTSFNPKAFFPRHGDASDSTWSLQSYISFLLERLHDNDENVPVGHDELINALTQQPNGIAALVKYIVPGISQHRLSKKSTNTHRDFVNFVLSKLAYLLTLDYRRSSPHDMAATPLTPNTNPYSALSLTLAREYENPLSPPDHEYVQSILGPSSHVCAYFVPFFRNTPVTSTMDMVMYNALLSSKNYYHVKKIPFPPCQCEMICSRAAAHPPALMPRAIALDSACRRADHYHMALYRTMIPSPHYAIPCVGIRSVPFFGLDRCIYQHDAPITLLDNGIGPGNTQDGDGNRQPEANSARCSPYAFSVEDMHSIQPNTGLVPTCKQTSATAPAPSVPMTKALPTRQTHGTGDALGAEPASDVHHSAAPTPASAPADKPSSPQLLSLGRTHHIHLSSRHLHVSLWTFCVFGRPFEVAWHHDLTLNMGQIVITQNNHTVTHHPKSGGQSALGASSQPGSRTTAHTPHGLGHTHNEHDCRHKAPQDPPEMWFNRAFSPLISMPSYPTQLELQKGTYMGQNLSIPFNLYVPSLGDPPLGITSPKAAKAIQRGLHSQSALTVVPCTIEIGFNMERWSEIRHYIQNIIDDYDIAPPQPHSRSHNRPSKGKDSECFSPQQSQPQSLRECLSRIETASDTSNIDTKSLELLSCIGQELAVEKAVERNHHLRLPTDELIASYNHWARSIQCPSDTDDSCPKSSPETDARHSAQNASSSLSPAGISTPTNRADMDSSPFLRDQSPDDIRAAAWTEDPLRGYPDTVAVDEGISGASSASPSGPPHANPLKRRLLSSSSSRPNRPHKASLTPSSADPLAIGSPTVSNSKTFSFSPQTDTPAQSFSPAMSGEEKHDQGALCLSPAKTNVSSVSRASTVSSSQLVVQAELGISNDPQGPIIGEDNQRHSYSHKRARFALASQSNASVASGVSSGKQGDNSRQATTAQVGSDERSVLLPPIARLTPTSKSEGTNPHEPNRRPTTILGILRSTNAPSPQAPPPAPTTASPTVPNVTPSIQFGLGPSSPLITGTSETGAICRTEDGRITHFTPVESHKTSRQLSSRYRHRFFKHLPRNATQIIISKNINSKASRKLHRLFRRFYRKRQDGHGRPTISPHNDRQPLPTSSYLAYAPWSAILEANISPLIPKMVSAIYLPYPSTARLRWATEMVPHTTTQSKSRAFLVSLAKVLTEMKATMKTAETIVAQQRHLGNHTKQRARISQRLPTRAQQKRMKTGDSEKVPPITPLPSGVVHPDAQDMSRVSMARRLQQQKVQSEYSQIGIIDYEQRLMKLIRETSLYTYNLTIYGIDFNQFQPD